MDAVSDLRAAATRMPDRGRLTDFLDRLTVLYDVEDELAALRALDAPMTLLPLEASVSLRGGASPPALRCSLGVVGAPGDPEGRAGLRGPVGALGAERRRACGAWSGRAGALFRSSVARPEAPVPRVTVCSVISQTLYGILAI
jgi:hypothetical protein